MTEISDRLLRIVFDTAVHSMNFGSGSSMTRMSPRCARSP